MHVLEIFLGGNLLDETDNLASSTNNEFQK